MKQKTEVPQREEDYSNQSNKPTLPWPKWNDMDIDSEEWDSDKIFEDPFGNGNVPLGVEAADWKRLLSFNYESRPVVSISEDHRLCPDLITPNIHILHVPLARCIITNIMNLQHLAVHDPFTIEIHRSQISENRRTTWKPWHHIYSKCSSKEFPLPNENGKYIVRLFYLGSWRKITVDDYIPVDKNNRILLPTSNVRNELWPIILSKAILRVAFMCLQDEKDISDFDVIMLLTGWIGKELTLKKMPHRTVWRQFRKLLSDAKNDTNQEVEKINETEQTEKVKNGNVITDIDALPLPVLESQESRKGSISSIDVHKEPFTEICCKSPIFAIFPTITETLTPFEKLTPCLSHPIVFTCADDVEYGTELRQLPQWKFYRWVDWAVDHKILSHAVSTFVKSVKFYSAYTCRTLPPLTILENGLMLYSTECNNKEVMSKNEYLLEMHEQIPTHEAEKVHNTIIENGDHEEHVKHYRLRSRSKRESFKTGRRKDSSKKYSIDRKVIISHKNRNQNGSFDIETKTEVEFPIIKQEMPRDIWCDLENILNCVSEFRIYYKLSLFPYIVHIPNDSHQEEHGMLKKREKSGGRHFSTPSISGIQQDVNTFVFLVIDSCDAKAILLNLSVLINNSSQEHNNDSLLRQILKISMNVTSDIKNCYIVGEKYNWSSRAIGETYFTLNTNVSRSIIIKVKKGLNVFRLWYKLSPHYSIILASQEEFTVCTLEKMQDIISNPSKSLLQQAGKIVDKFKKVVFEANKEGEKYNEKRHKKAVEVFRKSYFPDINYPVQLEDEVFHNKFDNAILKVMDKVIHDVSEFKYAVDNLRRILLNKDVGSEVFDEILHKKEELSKLEQQFMISSMFASLKLAKLKARLGKGDKSKTISAPSLNPDKQKLKDSDTVSTKQHNLLLDQITNVIDIFETMVVSNSELRNYYTSCDDIDHHISHVDYEGNCTVNNSVSEWTPIARLILNIHSNEEDTLCSVHSVCSSAFHILTVIDNDTLERLDKLFTNMVISVFKKNLTGYTAIIFVFPKNVTNTNISWKIRVLGARSSTIPHSCSWIDSHICSPIAPPTLTITKLQNKYVPNFRNIIYECVLTVKRRQIFTIRISLSNPNVSFESLVTDHNGNVLSNVRGVGNIMIPVIELIPESPTESANKEDVYKFYLKGVVLYDSWIISEKSKMSSKSDATDKTKSTPSLKGLAKKIMKRSKPLHDHTEEVVDILGTEYWVIQIFIDSDKTGSVTLESDGRREAKLKAMKEKFRKDPVKLNKAIKLRNKFRQDQGFKDDSAEIESTPKLLALFRNYSNANGDISQETIVVDEIVKSNQLSYNARREIFNKDISVYSDILKNLTYSQSIRNERTIAYLKELREKSDNVLSKAQEIIENYVPYVMKNNVRVNESKKSLQKIGKKKSERIKL